MTMRNVMEYVVYAGFGSSLLLIGLVTNSIEYKVRYNNIDSVALDRFFSTLPYAIFKGLFPHKSWDTYVVNAKIFGPLLARFMCGFLLLMLSALSLFSFLTYFTSSRYLSIVYLLGSLIIGVAFLFGWFFGHNLGKIDK